MNPGSTLPRTGPDFPGYAALGASCSLWLRKILRKLRGFLTFAAQIGHESIVACGQPTRPANLLERVVGRTILPVTNANDGQDCPSHEQMAPADSSQAEARQLEWTAPL